MSLFLGIVLIAMGNHDADVLERESEISDGKLKHFFFACFSVFIFEMQIFSLF